MVFIMAPFHSPALLLLCGDRGDFRRARSNPPIFALVLSMRTPVEWRVPFSLVVQNDLLFFATQALLLTVSCGAIRLPANCYQTCVCRLLASR